MNIIRKLGLALAGALLLAAALLVPVAGASEAQAEITDVSGDAVSRKDSRDLTAAFFHTETNDSFMINMTVSSLESYTNPNDIPNAPTSEYEVYFSVAQSNYAVACRVPVHGPFGITIQFDIRSVSYGNNTTTENQLSTLSGCTYDVADHSIRWQVAKTHFTNLSAGARLTNTWAAVYSKNFQDPQRHLEDRGPNTGHGKDYVIRGTPGTEILNVRLSAENLTQPCAPNNPAIFKITVFNNGTSTVNVELFNSTPDKKGWTVEFLVTNLTLLANQTRTVTVQVACPRDAPNRTSVTIEVSGKVTATTTNQTAAAKDKLFLTATVFYIPPKPVEDTFWVKTLNFFTKPTLWTYLVYALIALAVIGGGAAAAYSRMKRRRQEEPEPAAPAPLPAK